MLNAIPRPSGLGLGLSYGCLAHWRPSSASSSKRSCCLVMALPSIILGQMTLWSFFALAHTGFLAWYTKDWFIPRDATRVFSTIPVQILSRVSFQKKATNVSCLRHPTSIQPSSNTFPQQVPRFIQKMPRFFSAKSKKPLRLRKWSWSNMASRAKEDNHLQGPSVCCIRYIKIWLWIMRESLLEYVSTRVRFELVPKTDLERTYRNQRSLEGSWSQYRHLRCTASSSHEIFKAVMSDSLPLRFWLYKYVYDHIIYNVW